MSISSQVKPGDRAHNQAHYEALGDVITEEVYNQLQIVGGLQRKEVVLGEGSRKGPQSFVFVSPGFQEKERLQVVSKSNGDKLTFISGANTWLGRGKSWSVDSEAYHERGFGSW